MKLERRIIKEILYPKVMDWELAEKWADEIPTFSENNPKNPEWISTPTHMLDLSSEGYGVVFVKDESVNPTGTIKDRPAWELTALFRDFAKGLHYQKKERHLNGNIGSISVPRFSYISAGNVGTSFSNMLEKYGLPPIKIMVNSSIDTEKLEKLKKLRADIYMVDLSQKSLTPEDIKKLTNNENGIDITSTTIIEPNAIFYDWHVHEAFNEEPDEIYVPYGSGRIMENYLTWQMRNARNKDPRLRTSIGKTISMDILAARPSSDKSIADKLSTNYNPFVMHDDQEIISLSALSFTGKNTGVYKVPEERIKEAHEILSKYCNCEPSAAAGLALYMERFDKGLVSQHHKVLIINTGKGI